MSPFKNCKWVTTHIDIYNSKHLNVGMIYEHCQILFEEAKNEEKNNRYCNMYAGDHNCLTGHGSHRTK